MVYNIAAESCTVYLDRTCVIGRQKSSAGWREQPWVAKMGTGEDDNAIEMEQYSEARRFNMTWRLWHMQNCKRRLRQKPADILESSPKLWETKMEFIANSVELQANSGHGPIPEDSGAYFRQVDPEAASQTVKKSELRKVLGTPDAAPVQSATQGPIPATVRTDNETALREAFTRYHNQRSLNNRVAFLGDESSMRKFRNLERLERKLGFQRRRQGRIELEQKADIFFEQPSVRPSHEPFLFPMPTDPCIYSTNPISAWFLPFALSCTPESTANKFLRDPRTSTFAGHVFCRPSGTSNDCTWQRRWLCIRYNYLFEFLEEEDLMPIGVVCLSDTSCEISTDEESVQLSLFESRISASQRDTNHATSAPKKPLGAATHGSHSSYLNRLSLSAVNPKMIISIKPQDSSASSFYDIVAAAKKVHLDEMYSVNKSRIGQGRFAHVLPAKRKSDGKKCAVKVIRKHEFWALVEGGKERTDTVSREIATQLYLTGSDAECSGIVKLWDVFETKDFVVLELDLMQKIDLFQLLRSHKVLKEAQARKIVRHLVRTIGILQDKKIAHRDIKLSNIVFPSDESGEVVPKVVDFGMAAFVSNDGYVSGRCGTPGYVAPEILDARPNTGYENRVDLFSLGVVAYTLLCGYEPFYGTDERELIASNRRCLVSYDGKGWERISDEGKEFVKGLLTRDPKKRLTVAEALSHPWLRHPVEARRRLRQARSPENDEAGGCTIS